MSYPGITNHRVPVRGSDVVAFLGVRDMFPNVWLYSLWCADDNEMISTGEIDFGDMTVTPDQVARVAFLLDVEYGS